MLVLYPELRTSVLEQPTTQDRQNRVVYWRQKADLDPATVAAHGAVERLSTFGSFVAFCHPDLQLAQIPEPLFVRFWPKTVLVLGGATLARRALRRKRLVVVTYAIENLDTDKRLTIPILERVPWIGGAAQRGLASIVRATSLALLDGIAFGTRAAQQNYERFLALPRRGLANRLIPAELGLCPQCSTAGRLVPLEERVKRVLFLGELSRRKGLHTLFDAWAQSSLPSAGWQLVVCGSGRLGAEAAARSRDDRSVELRRPTRSEVHDLLSSSRAVVLPSLTVPRWREQIGLSLLEGEAHGCALIASSDSGIAADLAARAGAQIVPTGDACALTHALDRLSAITTVPIAAKSGNAVWVHHWFRSLVGTSR
jgi:hypothetical protein